MNSSYTFLFLTGIIYLFHMVLTNREEVIQQYFKTRFSNNEIFSVLSAHHNVSLLIRQLKRIFKKLGLSRRTPKSSINDVHAFVINELILTSLLPDA